MVAYNNPECDKANLTSNIITKRYRQTKGEINSPPQRQIDPLTNHLPFLTLNVSNSLNTT